MRRIWLVSLVLVGGFGVQALAEDAPSTADETRRAKVVATVGSETITVGELEDKIKARSPYARRRFAEAEVLKTFVDDQIQNELFYQGAEKLGYGEDPEVSRFLAQTIIQLFIRKEFEESLTPGDISEADIATYYKENPEQFRRPDIRRARHILVASEDDAKHIIEELGPDRARTFRPLAKERSLDTETKLRGGDLLFFAEDGTLVGREEGAAINATLAKVAFELEQTNELSEPIDLGDGKWSVLEVTDIRPEKVQTLEQASSGIRLILQRNELEGRLKKLTADLRAELKPEVHPERMDAIVLDPAGAPIEPPNP